MLQIKDIGEKEIRAMSYNELIGLTRETNRAPGGNGTIHMVASRLHIGPQHTILDIGTSTGSTALELSRLTGCTVVGIDINQRSIVEAQRRADLLGAVRTQFRLADAESLPFANNCFDIVFCGNVTSLVSDGGKALSEYRRVLKAGGYIVAVPMYYVDTPSDELVNRVRAAIKVNIAVKYRTEATEFYLHKELERYDVVHFRFEHISDANVSAFCDEILQQEHLCSMDEHAFTALKEVYLQYMLLFRDNLAHMGYSTVLLRKSSYIEDPQLFDGRLDTEL